MTRWVVTGPAGAGKSTFTRRLAERGAVVLDGDRLGHEILMRPRVLDAIVDRFGPQYIQDGVVNRPLLGRLVFGDAKALAKLNGITHGPLARLMEERLQEVESDSGSALAVLEAAVYFLLPRPPRADLVVLVTAASEIRYERLLAGGLTPNDARARIERQQGMGEAFAGADVTITNEGDPAELAAAADRLLAGQGAETGCDGHPGTGNTEEEPK